jgi:hypothetical protein
MGLNLAVQGKAGHNGVLYGLLIDHGQHAGHTQAHGANIGVWPHAKKVGTATAKHFAVGIQFDMDFHTDNGLVFHEDLQVEISI